VVFVQLRAFVINRRRETARRPTSVASARKRNRLSKNDSGVAGVRV